MEVVLLQDVEKVGLRGEVVSVARGYMRNYLQPRRLAEPASAAVVDELRRRDAERARHEARTLEQAKTIAETLTKTVLRFEVKAGPQGVLFGSITPDRHRRRALARPQDPGRPPQDRACGADQADRPLRDPDRGLPGRHGRGQDPRRPRRRRPRRRVARGGRRCGRVGAERRRRGRRRGRGGHGHGRGGTATDEATATEAPADDSSADPTPARARPLSQKPASPIAPPAGRRRRRPVSGRTERRPDLGLVTPVTAREQVPPQACGRRHEVPAPCRGSAHRGCCSSDAFRPPRLRT